MAFVGIRLNFVGFTICRTKRKKNSARDQLGWATAHFQSWVATLQWCHDRKSVARMTGVHARTTECLRTQQRT